MVTFKDKQIFIDGKPTFLLSGEMHYFREYNFEDNLNLGAFIDLCQENGLHFL